MIPCSEGRPPVIAVTAQYAVRALTELAALPAGASMGGRDLARVAGIPQNYLSKILRTLGTAGMIDATRGTGGGYRLRRAPRTIALAEVVGLFDPARRAADCLLDAAHPCSEATACAAHDTWRDIKAAYVAFLETTTLATLATSHRRIRRAGRTRRPRTK